MIDSAFRTVQRKWVARIAMVLLLTMGYGLSAISRAQITYTVQPGDSLRVIAERFSISLEELQKLNGLAGDTIQPGQILRLKAVQALTPRKETPAQTTEAVFFQRGMAAWYGPGFQGKPTANGETFNTYTLTAAHRTLPFGVQVRVTNLNNGRWVVVRINDRGPYSGGFIIDLSKAAAQRIGMDGIAPVTLEVLK